MTSIEKTLYEKLRDSKIEKVIIDTDGKKSKIIFDVINEIPELNERITLENASYEFCRAIMEIAESN